MGKAKQPISKGRTKYIALVTNKFYHYEVLKQGALILIYFLNGPLVLADVVNLFERKCVSCHHENGSARHLSFTNRGSIYEHRQLIIDSIDQASMPPWQAPGQKGFLNDPSLSTEEKNTLVSWLKTLVAPKGSETPLAPPARATKGSLVYRASREFHPLPSRNQIQCFVIDPGLTKDLYASVVQVEHSLGAPVHHSMVFAVPASFRERVKELEAREASPGFDCIDNQIHGFQISILGGWDFPLGDRGQTRIPAGSLLVLEVHYNTIKTREYRADQPKLIIDPAPALTNQIVHEILSPPEKKLIVAKNARLSLTERRRATFTPFSQGFFLHRVGLHMHRVGIRTQLNLVENGKFRSIVKIPDWNPDYASDFVLAEPLWVSAGASVELKCDYDNTENNPRRPLQNGKPRTIRWGYSFDDEMCLAILMISEKRAGS